MNEKEQLLQNINAAMPIAQQMQALETEINALEAEVEKKSHYGCGTVFVLGLGLLFGFIGIGILLSGLSKNSGDIKASLIFIVVIVLCLGYLFRRIKRVMTCKSQIGMSKQKLLVLRQDNSLSWLPESYRTSGCIAAIRSYLSDGRADTLKEALNLLETEMHRQRLEDSAFLGAYYANKSN